MAVSNLVLSNVFRSGRLVIIVSSNKEPTSTGRRTAYTLSTPKNRNQTAVAKGKTPKVDRVGGGYHRRMRCQCSQKPANFSCFSLWYTSNSSVGRHLGPKKP
jgi:hypothetical protein